MAMFDKRTIRMSWVSGVALVSAATLFGCGGGGDAPGTTSGGGGSNMGTAGVGNGTAGSPDVVGNPPVDMNGNPIVGGTDPGRVGLHRLNNQEYNNTVRDLLGDATAPASTFLAEEGLSGFDNTADALGMTPGQFEKYFDAARVSVDAAFANPAWVTANIPCTPVAASDPCVGTVLDSLGLRIYRRPLAAEEKAAALVVYDADFARAADGMAALREVIRSMVAAASFLYRVEFPTDRLSTAMQGLSSYELASRLSYLHWSTMPDQVLFDAAATNQLLDPAVLEAQVDRMLDDQRGNAFLANFGGQWLDFRDMNVVTPTPSIYPSFTEELRAALLTEGQMWFADFVQGNRPISEWFTGDFNFVNGTLAAHYGYQLPPGADANAFSRVESPGDGRVGFLGQGHFLTTTSFPGRTSPTLRAVWVLENMLCTHPPQPPPNVPQLEEAMEEGAPAADPSAIVNVRERLEAHRNNDACRACHESLDPMGLALENFDGIGAYRTAYSNGDAIETGGSFTVFNADGTTTPTPFTDVVSLASVLQTDARFPKCVAEKVFTYALGRSPVPADDAYLAQIRSQWATRGLNIRNLLKTVVVNDTFRFSRGEAL
jgi:hypothetical protein